MGERGPWLTAYTYERLACSPEPIGAIIRLPSMCIDKAGNITDKTLKNCVDLVAYLIKKCSLTINDIWTHKGIVGWKDCPLPWVKNPSEFERFKREVGKRLHPVVEEEEEEVDKCNVTLNGKPIAEGLIIP